MHADSRRRSFASTSAVPESSLRAMGQAKKKKQRECPAKGVIITPEDCGRGRNSTIACPADCPHNPFAAANYREQFGALEEKVLSHLSRKLAPELTPAQLREIRGLIETRSDFALHAFQVWEIHGTGRLEKWMAEGLQRDWKNDERVLLGHLAGLRPALLQFREVLDEVSVMAVDLLEPGEPFVLIDAATAGKIGRFETCLGWIYPVPAGMRMSGGLAKVPGVFDLEPAEMLHRLLDHLGAPEGERRPWILEHMTLLTEAFAAIGAAQRCEQIGVTDFREFTLRHSIADGLAPSVIAALEAHPRVFVEAAEQPGALFAASLLADGVDRERDEVADILGSLHVFPQQLEIKAFSEARVTALRPLITSLGLSLGPETVEVVDTSPKKPDDYDRDLVPGGFADGMPPLEFKSAVFLRQSAPASNLDLLYRGFADKPSPGLDGKSPREAAADPLLRPKLVRLMKQLVGGVDRQRRDHGIDFDLNPVLLELGLHELILPPPPLGLSGKEDDLDEEIPLDPPPSQRQLEVKEIDERITRIMEDESLWNRLEIRLADILDAFNDLSQKFNAGELEVLQTTALAVLGTLHPDQPPGYDPNPERMIARFETWLASGDERETTSDYFDRIFAETRQPELCEEAADLLTVLGENAGKKLRPKKLEAILTALAAAIWEAAHWPPQA